MKFEYQNTSGVTKSQINMTFERLRPYISTLKGISKKNTYEQLEASINAPSDEKIVKVINKTIKQKVSDKLKYIIVIGIGGSNLGTMAIYEALKKVKRSSPLKEILFIDTPDDLDLEYLLSKVEQNITDKEELLICSISKSGGTAETITNTEIVYSYFERIYPNISERLVVVSNEGSKYWKAAQEKNITTLPIPELVGGRYSVFTPVGLFPLAAAGVDIKKLLLGAKEVSEGALAKSVTKNNAAVSAIILYRQYKKDRYIHDTFLFHKQLESLGKWYRQLLAESIGKEKNKHEKVVHIGITPTVSIGSTDLHSVGQLYLGGPKDKITTFVSALKVQSFLFSVPKNRLFPNLVPMVSNLSAHKLIGAIMQGTKIAYKKKRLPYMEITFDDITEKSIGSFMQFKMFEVMYLGHLLNLHTFDQPNVENYKLETKKILTK